MDSIAPPMAELSQNRKLEICRIAFVVIPTVLRDIMLQEH